MKFIMGSHLTIAARLSNAAKLSSAAKLSNAAKLSSDWGPPLLVAGRRREHRQAAGDRGPPP